MPCTLTRWLLPFVELDYSFLTASARITQTLTENLTLLPTAEAVLEVLVRTIFATSPAHITFVLQGVAQTEEDPHSEFAGPATAVISTTAATPWPTLLATVLTGPVPSLARLQVSVQQCATGGEKLVAVAAVRLTLRNVDRSAARELVRAGIGWVQGTSLGERAG